MASKLRTLRKKKGLTQDALAKRAKVSRSVIARYETGKTRLSSKSLISIANTLGTSLDDIVEIGGETDAKTAVS